MIKKKNDSETHHLSWGLIKETVYLGKVWDPWALALKQGEESRWPFKEPRVLASRPGPEAANGQQTPPWRGRGHISDGESLVLTGPLPASQWNATRTPCSFLRPSTSRALTGICKERAKRWSKRGRGVWPPSSQNVAFPRHQGSPQATYANGPLKWEPSLSKEQLLPIPENSPKYSEYVNMIPQWAQIFRSSLSAGNKHYTFHVQISNNHWDYLVNMASGEISPMTGRVVQRTVTGTGHTSAVRQKAGEAHVRIKNSITLL